MEAYNWHGIQGPYKSKGNSGWQRFELPSLVYSTIKRLWKSVAVQQGRNPQSPTQSRQLTEQTDSCMSVTPSSHHTAHVTRPAPPSHKQLHINSSKTDQSNGKGPIQRTRYVTLPWTARLPYGTMKSQPTRRRCSRSRAQQPTLHYCMGSKQHATDQQGTTGWPDWRIPGQTPEIDLDQSLAANLQLYISRTANQSDKVEKLYGMHSLTLRRGGVV